jgi:methylation protein EvaC
MSFKKLAKKIKNLRPKNILEIGSNDGTFMNNFNNKNIIGIEPCKNVEILTKRKGLNTYPYYWNNKTSKFLKKKYGKFDLVFSANTLSHIKNLDNVFKNIFNVLSDNGILIIEDPSLLDCLKSNTYDQFYNEHIYVFSCIGLNEVLKKNNLEIYKVEKLKIHGGSNRYYIKKKLNKKNLEKSFIKQISNEKKYGLHKEYAYFNFSKRVKKSRNKLKEIFQKLKKNNKKIIGYGATAKSTTILNYCGINYKYIDYFLDTTPDKQNKYTPGTKIKIHKYNNGIKKNVDFVFLGAWNFKDEIFKKEKKFINNGGKFITHRPYPKIL